MHLTPGSQVCFGCGLPLGAEATPLAAPVAPQPVAPVEAPVATDDASVEEPAVEEAAVENPLSGFAERSQTVVTTVLATPAVRGPLLSFDPLPPVAASVNEDPYVTASVTAPAAAAIPVEETDGTATIRGHAHSTEETLAVPAAYATFAPEPPEPPQRVSERLPDAPVAAVADVVTLDFPAVLTVAPPQAPVAEWPTSDEQRRAAEGR